MDPQGYFLDLVYCNGNNDATRHAKVTNHQIIIAIEHHGTNPMSDTLQQCMIDSPDNFGGFFSPDYTKFRLGMCVLL